jgi:hypothetical protein
MRARLTGAVAALVLAATAAPAAAQDPTPTPTPSPTATPTPSATPSPTPTPEEERDERDRESKSVRRIYRDFERDGRIDDCDHTVKALKKARRSIEDSYKEEYPDFRDALTAALDRHDAGRCEEQEQELDDRNEPGKAAGGGIRADPRCAPEPGAVEPSGNPQCCSPGRRDQHVAAVEGQGGVCPGLDQRGRLQPPGQVGPNHAMIRGGRPRAEDPPRRATGIVPAAQQRALIGPDPGGRQRGQGRQRVAVGGMGPEQPAPGLHPER